VWNATKKLEFEPVDFLHTNWLNYSNNHDLNKDVEPLYPLLSDSSTTVNRTHAQILDALYNATLVILESTPILDSAEKTRAEYFSYNLCSCDECQKVCGAHINKKGQIRISQKFFQDNIQAQPPAGLLELMYSILHQMLHGIFPDLDEEVIVDKTQQAWTTGITELVNEKLGKMD
jgi:hypothetical protein